LSIIQEAGRTHVQGNGRCPGSMRFQRQKKKSRKKGKIQLY